LGEEKTIIVKERNKMRQQKKTPDSERAEVVKE